MEGTLPWIYLTFAGLMEIGRPVGLKMAQAEGQRVICVTVALAFRRKRISPSAHHMRCGPASALPGRSSTGSCFMATLRASPGLSASA